MSALPADPLGVPSPWVRRFAHLVPAGGRVLDLAAGGGRHSRFFADRGHSVLAIDRDIRPLEDLVPRPGVSVLAADLESGGALPFAGETFAGIIVTHYLFRPLFPALIAAVAPGGVLLYETFGRGQGAYGRPSSPGFLLEPGELLTAVAPALTVVAYESGLEFTPQPRVIQRIAAINGPGPAPL